jgi:hypothetical protein
MDLYTTYEYPEKRERQWQPLLLEKWKRICHNAREMGKAYLKTQPIPGFAAQCNPGGTDKPKGVTDYA